MDLDQTLSWEVNVLATQQLIEKAIRVGDLQQFIFASSGSVYGVKDELDVTEDLVWFHLCLQQNEMVAERVLKSYSDKVKVQHSSSNSMWAFASYEA